LHEIAHIVHLHALTEVAGQTFKFYVAHGGEPIGAHQPMHGKAQSHGMMWRALGEYVGVSSDPGYRDFPISGTFANLWDQYAASASARLPQCRAAIDRVQLLRFRLPASPLDEILPVKPWLADETAAALQTLRDCVADDPLTLHGLVAGLGSAWANYLRQQLTTGEYLLLDMPALPAILELILTRRKAQWNTEMHFLVDTGAPWSAIRYYSYEEQADDYAIHIGRANRLTTLGVNALMMKVLGDAAPTCLAQIATGRVPYGKNLLDDHHAPCWRIAHAWDVATWGQTAARSLAPPRPARAPWVPVREEVPRLLD
jgi:hypothetical protein